MAGVPLHDAMVLVLADGNWMTFAEVAELVNESGRYRRRLGDPVDAGQIRLRATLSGGAYEHLFDVDGDRIRLAKSG